MIVFAIIVLIIGVVALNAVMGYKNGLIKYSVHAVAGVAACAIALIGCNCTHIVDNMYNKLDSKGTFDYIDTKVDTIAMMVDEYGDINRAVDDIYKSLSPKAIEMLSVLNNGEEDIKSEILTILKSQDDEISNVSLSENLKNNLIAPMFKSIIKGFLFIILFIASYIFAIALGVAIGGMILTVKIADNVNKTAGAVCGVICGITYGVIIIILTNIASMLLHIDIGILKLL